MNNQMRIAIGCVCTTGKNTVITEKLAEKLNVKDAFAQWKLSVDTLYDLALEYAEVYNDREVMVSSAKFADAERRVFQQWQRVLSFGEEDMLHPKMFVRPQDAETLRTWATGMVIISTPKTRKFAHTGSTTFRKYVETLVYTRATCANLISDEHREAFQSYNKIAHQIKSKKAVLDGKGDALGIRKQLENAEKALENCTDLLRAAGLDPAQIAVVTADRVDSINKMRDDIKTLEEELKNLEEELKDLEKPYKVALNIIDDVEKFDIDE